MSPGSPSMIRDRARRAISTGAGTGWVVWTTTEVDGWHPDDMTQLPPTWLVTWCRRELHAEAVEVLFAAETMSTVVGVRLDDGRRVAVKSRPDECGRAALCVAVQQVVSASGFSCPTPLTGVTLSRGRAVHAEDWRPGGQMLRGDGPAVAVLFAVLFADLMSITVDLAVPPPLPNPPWVRWDDEDPGRWPTGYHDELAAAADLPPYIEQTACRARARIIGAALPPVIGHADWETQNLRWKDRKPYAIHDWDSLAWLPEAVLVGAASGTFARAETLTLAPLDSSAAFLSAYEHARGHVLTAEEREVAWAASLLPAVHNARGETICNSPPVATAALREQAVTRLAHAGA